jgi:alpha-beta hydrolase superfamily lysophospholipase
VDRSKRLDRWSLAAAATHRLDQWSLAAAATHRLDQWSLAAAATHRLDQWSLAAAATHRLDRWRTARPRMTELSDELRPRVAVRSPAAGEDVRGVVLVLPGGQARSTAPASRRHLAYQRMRPFAAAVHAGLGGRGIAVWQLRYRVRGWNGDRRDPVWDARWAIDRVHAHHPGAPVFVLGHSMGGRTALYVAGDDGVLGACALAPWIEPHDPIAQLAGRLVVIAHGDDDRMTDPRRSRAYSVAAAGAGARVADFTVVGDRHAMLRRAADWHALARAAAGLAFGVDTPATDSGAVAAQLVHVLAGPPEQRFAVALAGGS